MDFRRYTRELYDRPKASLLHLKTQMGKYKVVEALLNGCTTWTPLKGPYNNKLHTTHHSHRFESQEPNESRRTAPSSLINTPSSEPDARVSRQPYARGGWRGRGCCFALVTTGYPRGSCREAWRTQRNVDRWGRRNNGRTAWHRIVGCWVSRKTGVPPDVRLLKQPCTREGCCSRGRCPSWTTTGYPRESCRKSSIIRKNAGRGGKRNNGWIAWQRIVGCLASQGT